MERQTDNNREQGQSLVELAMSLVVLLILVAGLVDLGRAFFTYVALRDAAQEGASYASVVNDETMESASDLNNYCAAIANRVIITTTDLSGGAATSNGPINLQSLKAAGELAIQTTINGAECGTLSPADVCMGGAVRVEVSYDHFPLTMPFIGSILGTQELSISANVVDTILTPACQ